MSDSTAGSGGADKSKRELLQTLDDHLAYARQKSHEISERATIEGTKMLAAILGGLGAIVAAWLQRIFGDPSANEYRIANFLAVTEVWVMLGLISLGLVHLFDVRSSHYVAESSNKSSALNIVLTHAKAIDDGNRARIVQYRKEMDDSDRKAKLANVFSNSSFFASWLMLALAFGTVALGVLKSL